MKVKYIRESNVSLTNGKEYDVLSVELGNYRIVDDTGEDYIFDYSRIYLAYHFPVDIALGLLTGVVSGGVGLLVLRLIKMKDQR